MKRFTVIGMERVRIFLTDNVKGFRIVNQEASDVDSVRAGD